jgi:hypothetical protein
VLSRVVAARLWDFVSDIHASSRRSTRIGCGSLRVNMGRRRARRLRVGGLESQNPAIDFATSTDCRAPRIVQVRLDSVGSLSLLIQETPDEYSYNLAHCGQIAAPYTVVSRSDYWIYAYVRGLVS